MSNDTDNDFEKMIKDTKLRMHEVYDILSLINKDYMENYMDIIKVRMNKNILGNNSRKEYEKTVLMCLTSVTGRLILSQDVNEDYFQKAKDLINKYRSENLPSLLYINDDIEIDTIVDDALPCIMFEGKKDTLYGYIGNSLFYTGSNKDECSESLKTLWKAIVE